MTGWLFGLGSAVLYGVSDFVGGLASRRSHFVVVALLGQLAGLLATVVAGVLFSAKSTPPEDLWWGALSGLGTAAGMAFLFRGISRGAMSVVVPISAVTGVSIPVLFGVAIEHQRPSLLAWIGIVIAVPALWLVAGGQGRETGTVAGGGVGDGLLAGVGIAVQYLALARASSASGLWPVAAGRVSAVVVLLALSVALVRGRFGEQLRSFVQRMPAASAALAVTAGVTAAAALAAYAVATRHQLAAIAVVLSSLYPVIPVILGVTMLRERLAGQQTAGLLAAGSATVLLAV